MRDLTPIELEAVAGGAAREPIKGRITPRAILIGILRLIFEPKRKMTA
jgi:hypothetical protein